MKKIFFVLGALALAVAGFAMFKILTFNDHGKDTETNPTEAGNALEEKSEETSKEAGTGINP